MLKHDVGSHRKGFYRINYEEERNAFFGNGEQYDFEVIELIQAIEENYIGTEYVQMNIYLKRIYDKVIYTVRVMTIMDNDSMCPIKYAYFRIGTNCTGNTDNLDSGGIVATVDVKTAEFGYAELLDKHNYVKQPIYPDTGKKIEGFLPNWQKVISELNVICKYLKPFEYLGLDIVITDESFKFLEVNTYQDLHKFKDHPEEVKQYLFKKLSQIKFNKYRNVRDG